MVPEKNGEETASAPLRSLCIVIADDDRDAVLTLSMLLREEGHEVHVAHDAKQALDQVLKNDPDALLLDIALGSSSGFEVAQTVRARHGDARPLIIGVSGVYKKGSDRILAEINGFNHYLLKPYEPNALFALLAPLRQPRRRAEDDVQLEQENTYRAALGRAAAFVGGARRLSERLGVSMPDLTRWLAGQGRPPLDVFLRAVDIMLRDGKEPSPHLRSSDIIPFRAARRGRPGQPGEGPMPPAQAPTSERPARRQGPVRILVVDDEPDTVITLLTILRDDGYEAKGFSHPLEALKALREFDPDVVICDIAMPVLSGWELARRVQESMGDARPVMIAISGVYQKSADKVLAAMSGYAFFLAKPCDPGVVITLIERAMGSGQA